MKEPPSLSPVVFAVRRAERSKAALPGAWHTTLPLPVPGADGTLWGVWLAPGEQNPETGALRIGVPEYGLFFRADFGAFAELRGLAPRDFGLSDKTAPWLGDVPDADDRNARRGRLFELLQAATPGFAAGPRGLTPAARRAAAEIKTLFPEVAEPPLLPCYRRAARRFFAWLDVAAP
jgi:hypothetical protein